MDTNYSLNKEADDVAIFPDGMSQPKAKKENLFWVWLDRYLRLWDKYFELDLHDKYKYYYM